MEVIIDQLDTVKLNSGLEKVNNPEKITNLVIKNYNKEVKWHKLENFTNLEILHLENCWLDNFSFLHPFPKFKNLQHLNIMKIVFSKNLIKKLILNFPN